MPDGLTSICHPLAIGLYSAAFLVALADLQGIKSWSRWPLRTLLGGGVLVQTIMIAGRWQAGNHFPVTGLFETLHFLAFWVAGITLYFELRYRSRAFVPAGLALALLALASASLGPKKIFPLTPALDTPLFFIHVATSFAAYGLWGAAALLAVYDLATRDQATAARWQRMQDECLYIGYILFTLCMLAGSLWAYLAWGSYWTWKIKGLWSYILWFYYSGALHVRRNPRWQGWPADLLALAGFILVLFTYLGLGLLFKTNHPLL
jgi:ABC-type transport system involved in cytochrome c biogenesis permease subunit